MRFETHVSDRSRLGVNIDTDVEIEIETVGGFPADRAVDVVERLEDAVDDEIRAIGDEWGDDEP